jgi:flavin reductase (DIM6/NTAB) family NADH-FMN oxidoreductase RutF
VAAVDLARRMVARDAFRETLSSVPTGLTVVTTMNGDGRPHGTTVSAFSSLSLDPPLVLVALDRASELLAQLRGTGRFGVNVLAEHQQDVGLACGRKGEDKMAGLDWCDEDGLPRIADTVAWLACDVEQLLPGGDHEIVVGLVTDCDTSDAGALIFHRRSFHRVARK